MVLLADLVLIVHAMFIAFVVVGLVLTVIGGLAGWRWVRNPWFRGTHLLAIAYVVGQSWLGLTCPLTTWESDLRIAAGQTPYTDNGFIADWLHRLIFFRAPAWVFAVAYSVFGLLVVTTLGWVRPRAPRRRRGTTSTPA